MGVLTGFRVVYRFRSRTLVQVNSRIDNDSNLKPPGAEGERRLGGLPCW